MTYWVCHYHIVWATKNRQPLITPSLEACILRVIRQQSHKLRAPLHAINTVADHIHVAVDIPPSLSVSKWVGAVKGASAYQVNGMFLDLSVAFTWQACYSVHTFGDQALDMIVAYVDNQKTHHAENRLYNGLERINGD